MSFFFGSKKKDLKKEREEREKKYQEERRQKEIEYQKRKEAIIAEFNKKNNDLEEKRLQDEIMSRKNIEEIDKNSQ